MKIAILFDTKFGNTKKLAEFLAAKTRDAAHEVQLFQTHINKPEDLLSYAPTSLLVGAPTHAGAPARALGRFLKKLGKLLRKSTESTISKVGVFNCYNAKDVCYKIKDKILAVIPEVQIYEGVLPINTGNYKGTDWEDNWEVKTNAFIKGFLDFL